MIKSSSRPRSGSTYIVSGGHAGSPRQPFSINLGKQGGKIEVIFSHSSATPVVSTSQGTGHSSRYEERREDSGSRYPKPPRSDVATIGSTTYLHSSSSSPRTSHSSPSPHHHSEHRSSSSPRQARQELPLRSPRIPAGTYLAVPATNDHGRRSSGSRVEESRPVAISHSATNSPQKHAHFALPHSAPSNMTLPERVSASPRQPTKHHHHSHSQPQDSYVREVPRGWYNRRGDQFIQRGVVKKLPAGLEWTLPLFAHYPAPGDGWMNEKGQFLSYHGGILKHAS